MSECPAPHARADSQLTVVGTVSVGLHIQLAAASAGGTTLDNERETRCVRTKQSRWSTVPIGHEEDEV